MTRTMFNLKKFAVDYLFSYFLTGLYAANQIQFQKRILKGFNQKI